VVLQSEIGGKKKEERKQEGETTRGAKANTNTQFSFTVMPEKQNGTPKEHCEQEYSQCRREVIRGGAAKAQSQSKIAGGLQGLDINDQRTSR